jgi:hypothetical protein
VTVDLGDVARKLRTTLGTTSVAAAFLPLAAQLAGAERAFRDFGVALGLDGRPLASPQRGAPLPIKAPPPAPLQGTRPILFEDED